MKIRRLFESYDVNDYSEAIAAAKRGFILHRGRIEALKHGVEYTPTIRTASQYGFDGVNVSRFMDKVFDSWSDTSTWIPRRESIFCSRSAAFATNFATNFGSGRDGGRVSIVLFKNGARLNSSVSDFNFSNSWKYLQDNVVDALELRVGRFRKYVGYETVYELVNGLSKLAMNVAGTVMRVESRQDLIDVISHLTDHDKVDEMYRVIDDLVDPVKNGFKSFTLRDADDKGSSGREEVWSNSPYVLISLDEFIEVVRETS